MRYSLRTGVERIPLTMYLREGSDNTGARLENMKQNVQNPKDQQYIGSAPRAYNVDRYWASAGARRLVST